MDLNAKLQKQVTQISEYVEGNRLKAVSRMDRVEQDDPNQEHCDTSRSAAGEHFCRKRPRAHFKALGGELEIGYCFGDDIAVYRMTADGKELLGQFSNPSVSPPDAFKGRIIFSAEVLGLIGLKLTNLQFSDSGIYIRECWSNNTMENYRKHYLYVCDKEFDFKEISLIPGTGADLECNMDSIKHATVKWYRDMHNVSLFMDTKISLEPLHAEFKSLIRVHGEGSFLHVSDEFIQDRPRFFCQVMEGEQCRSFQTIGLPDSELKTIIVLTEKM